MAEPTTVVQKVYPTRLELEQESKTNVPCPIIGCTKIFRHSAALRFHLVRLHKRILNESDARLARQSKFNTKIKYEFHCPEPKCKFNSERSCDWLKNLKQHYLRMHVEKTYCCSICDMKFGLGYDLTDHEARCRAKPWCLSCKMCMENDEDLDVHCRETGHVARSLAELGQVKPDSQGQTIDLSSKSVCILPDANGTSTVTSESQDGSSTSEPHRRGRRSSKRKDNSSVETIQKIAPKYILPAANLLVLPSTSGTTMFLYSTSVFPSTPPLQKLAPKPVPNSSGDFPGLSAHSSDTNKCDSWTACPEFETVDMAALSVSSSSRTTQTRHRKIKAAETQTTGEYTVRKTQGSRNLAPSKQSCGSQVSPRAKVKYACRDVQSIETQTSRVLPKKRRVTSTRRKEERTFEAIAVPSMQCYNDGPDLSHSGTQTTFLPDLGFSENSSTQTLESYLLDQVSNENYVGAYGGTDVLQEPMYPPPPTYQMQPMYPTNSTYPTIISGELLHSAALPSSVDQPQEPINGENSETNSPEFSNLLNGNGAEEPSTHLAFPDDLLDASMAAAAMSDGAGDMLSMPKTSSIETQTVDANVFPDFLTAASQTNDLDHMMSMNTETQTTDEELFEQFLSNMQTQTTDEFLTEFGFSDIETQTMSIFEWDQLSQNSMFSELLLSDRSTMSTDMETQTHFQ